MLNNWLPAGGQICIRTYVKLFSFAMLLYIMSYVKCNLLGKTVFSLRKIHYLLHNLISFQRV